MPEKALTPEEFLKKVSKEDKEAIVDISGKKKLDLIPSGSWVIDTIIGDGSMTGKPGGFPRGHIVEIFGDESSGKTTLALTAISKAQEMGGLGILMDFEQTFMAQYAAKIGVDLDKKRFMPWQPMSFQQGARQIKDCLLMKPAIIVVDSVSAMLPRQFLEGSIDEAQRIGLQAQLMSAFLGYISKFLKASNTCLLFTNQLRSVIKKSQYEGGPDEESSGGRALKFYSSLRLKLETSTVEKVAVTSRITGKEDKEPVNVKVKATVVKNKIDRPWFSAPIYIRFGEGIDNVRSIIELAVNIGTIKKTGAFFSFAQGEEILFKVQGIEQLWQMLSDDSKMFNKVQSSLVIKEDEKVKEEYKNVVQDIPPDEIDDMLSNVADNFIQKSEAKKKKKEDAAE